MKTLLSGSAVLEAVTGIALLSVPALVAFILLGESLTTPASLAVARVAGAALLSLAVACWFASRDCQSHAARPVTAAMLVYNVSVAGVLLSAHYHAGLNGLALLPAAALHTGLALGCLACLAATSGTKPNVAG